MFLKGGVEDEDILLLYGESNPEIMHQFYNCFLRNGFGPMLCRLRLISSHFCKAAFWHRTLNTHQKLVCVARSDECIAAVSNH